MMDEIRCRVEIREDDTRQSPGRLTGVLLTYGERAADRAELFEDGALYWRDSGIVIREQHNRAAPIVRAQPYMEGRELRVNVPLPNTQRGRDAAIAMQGDNPLYSGLSVEFNSERETRRNGLRVITRAFLDGASLVDTPAYLGSTVEVREESGLFVPRSVFTWL